LLTIQEIYDAALAMVCEVEESNANTDYEARAPYLVAATCYRYASLDVLYRQVNGLEKQNLLAVNRFPLGATFPLCDEFGPAVSASLAGMLVLSENPEMSERLIRLSDDLIAELRRRIPFQKERIVSKYAL